MYTLRITVPARIRRVIQSADDEDNFTLSPTVVDDRLFKQMDGWVITEDAGEISIYLGCGEPEIELWDLGMRGGTFTMRHPAPGRLVCVIEYTTPCVLNERQLEMLHAFHDGQLSDGFGEEGFAWGDDDDDEAEYLLDIFLGEDVQVEYIAAPSVPAPVG